MMTHRLYSLIPSKGRLVGVFLLLAVLTCSAQPLPFLKHKEIVHKGEYLVSKSSYDYSGVTKIIVGNETSAYLRAKKIYQWLCDNVEYDVSMKIRTADEAWDAKRAVCQGYCELFYRLAEPVGLKCHLVYGKVKHSTGFLNTMETGSLEEHVWLCAETERGLIFMDPTWGAGRVLRDRFFKNELPMEWFDVSSEWLRFTHFPKKKRYRYMTEKEFLAMPYATPAMEIIGLSAARAQELVAQGVKKFPRLFTKKLTQTKIKSVPLDGTLRVGGNYSFVVDCQPDCHIEIRNGNDTYKDNAFYRSADGFLMTVSPKKTGRLTVLIEQKQGPVPMYYPLLEYIVE